MGRPEDDYADLKALPHWRDAEAQLKGGASAEKVAEYLQHMGHMLQVKKETLARRLRRYRKRQLKIMPIAPTYIDHRVGEIAQAIDDVEELTKLIVIQKQRVSKDLKLEENMPKLAPWLLKEVQALFDMIERRARLLQDLGILYKAPEKHMVAVFGDETWAKLLETLDPDQRTRAREIVQMEYAREREAQDAEARRHLSGLYHEETT